MEEQKNIIKDLISKQNFDIVKSKDADFSDMCNFFEGTPKKSLEQGKVQVITNPFSKDNIIYEFLVKDVEFAEEIGTLTSEDGKTAIKVRLWIKKGSWALQTKPFIV